MSEYRLVKTCTACPEQYEVYLGNTRVGYIRARFGVISASLWPANEPYPMDDIFVKDFGHQYDGVLPEEQRSDLLKEAVLHIHSMLLVQKNKA